MRVTGFILACCMLATSAFAANDFYTHGSFPATGSSLSSSAMRAELDLISAGFDKLPGLSGNGSKGVVVNSGGTALTVTTGTLTLAGNFATSGTSALTLTTTGATNVTLPTTGTLATLAGTETFTNKTLTSPVLTTPSIGLTGLLIGNGASAITAYSGATCTNQFVTALSTAGAGTCTTATLAGPQFANQGTTTTVLHGNAAGNPSWAAVALTTDVTGTLGVGNGGTGLTSGNSGGLLGYTASGTLASSATLALNGFVLGGGLGGTPTSLQLTGLVKGNGASAPTAATVGTDYCSSASTCETGTWSAAGKAKDTVYQNSSGRKRRVSIVISAAAASNDYVSVLVGSANPPTLEVALCGGSGLTGVSGGNIYCTVSFEVPATHYYKAATGAGTISVVDWNELDE